MTTCLFCREELTGLICAHCHARELPEMAVWADDDAVCSCCIHHVPTDRECCLCSRHIRLGKSVHDARRAAVRADDDDSRAQRGEETRLERLLRESVARAAELRKR